MERLERQPGTLRDKIEQAYQHAVGKWSGCDWRTEFGQGRLNLRGMKSPQAALMAGATAGNEAENWRAAVAWLSRVEREAQEAEAQARRAVLLALSDKLQEALDHARRACAIEAKYHTELVWWPLQDVLEASVQTAFVGAERKAFKL